MSRDDKHGTAIEWTHIPGFKGETWNPIVGCSVVSPGCTNCYAMKMAARLEKMGTPQYSDLTEDSKAGPVWNGSVKIVESVFSRPLYWVKPRAIFVNSMGDLFHESISNEDIAGVFAVMALSPQHVFMVLTKRASRMRAWLSHPGAQKEVAHYIDLYAPMVMSMSDRHPNQKYWRKGAALVSHDWTSGGDVMTAGRATGLATWPLPNVWLGASAEDQKRANERIPELVSVPAAKRFLSIEPMLGPIDLTNLKVWLDDAPAWLNVLSGGAFLEGNGIDRIEYFSNRVDWVIAGGESGGAARPMHPAWARSLRDQCAAAGVPFFFKQWGEWLPVCEMSTDLEAKLYPPAPKADPLRTMPSRYDHRVLDTDGVLRSITDGPAFTGPSPMGVFKVGKRNAGHLLDGAEHQNWPEITP